MSPFMHVFSTLLALAFTVSGLVFAWHGHYSLSFLLVTLALFIVWATTWT